MHDAVIISDIHLGSDNCQARKLCRFLENIACGDFPTKRLILNGDVFDSFDFRRLQKNHWKALSLLRKLAGHLDIIWLCGNHDGSADIVSHLLGVTVQDEYVLASGQQQVLILHGHVFDTFLDDHPILTWLGDSIYHLLQKIDQTHTVARWAKKSNKTFLRCAERIEDRAIEAARKQNCTAVCCGHTHQACVSRRGGLQYINSGCWTETPTTYVTVTDGLIEVRAFEPALALEHELEFAGNLLAS